MRSKSFTLVELMIVIGIITIIAAIALPNILEARINANETAAIGALKSIGSAQAIFRDRDKEGDGNNDYGDLAELGMTGVIDDVLLTGTKSGFVFQCGAATANTQNRQFLYWSLANPSVPGASGKRSFASNHEGVIYYTQNVTLTAVPPFTTDAVIPAGMLTTR